MDKIQIYGILNVTPDSFSDGGKYFDVSSACERALAMKAEGADVIDIGGMSTRPGFEDVPEADEIQRVVPVISKIKSEDPSCVISVDTFRSGTAKACLEAGADIINDISGLMADPKMGEVIAGYGCEAVLMRDGFSDPSIPWKDQLQKTVDRAKQAGIKDDKIILDPGVGFTSTRQQDMELIRAIPEIKIKWGYPVLLGVSRKRITAQFYEGTSSPEQRVGASIALALYGVNMGATLLRVHDVKDTAAAVKAWMEIRNE